VQRLKNSAHRNGGGGRELAGTSEPSTGPFIAIKGWRAVPDFVQHDDVLSNSVAELSRAVHDKTVLRHDYQCRIK
jgi:hypothetical protein